MRRSEITPELIELSKRAKELGFPQDVEEGDWVGYCKIGFNFERKYFFKHVQTNKQAIKLNNSKQKNHFLILSFSRCLEWLEDNNKGEMIGLDLNNFIHGHWIMGIKTKTYRGKNIHEVGAKAMVKRLEGD